MFGLATIKAMNAAPEPVKPLTVGALKRLLEPISDGVFLAVECENRCEPHPITTTFGPYEKESRGRGAEDAPTGFYLTFFQNDRIDLATPFEEDED